MKQLIYGLILSLILAPVVQAASIYTDYTTLIPQNKLKDLFPLTIETDANMEITADDGINLILDKDKYILWNDSELTASGTAVTNGRIEPTIMPTFYDDYKILHIPVLSDWEAGEKVVLNNLQMRAYGRSFGNKYIGLDVSGDRVADAQDVNEYLVTSDVRRDVVSPFPVENLEYTVNDTQTQVKLTWNNPPDYDLTSVTVERILIRGGSTRPAADVLSGLLLEEYTDTDVEPGDTLIYTVFARDALNAGERMEVTVDLMKTPEEEEVVEPEEPVTEPEDEMGATEDEVNELSRLLNYYNVRYSIKCMPSGVAVAENNSACLWARIDLIYAQDLTDEDKVTGLELSERDLELMETRRRWPEQRYEDNCITAAEPASYCPALGKALDRISYFLD